ncbi:MAG: hypothetical protein NTY02_01435, partial [Acidobacteria bacterium]|nr:hypothetical protein [Acidobacteriota bacterium]
MAQGAAVDVLRLGARVMRAAALLRAGLADLAGRPHGRDQAFALVEGVRGRLLHVHMLAGRERGQRDRQVQVVGHADEHGIDIGARQGLF